MNKTKTNMFNYGFAVIAVLFIFGVFTGSVHAQWQNLGNGVYRDNNGNEWKNFNTVTGSLQAAEQTVAKQGFRLPTHSEFRSLEGNGGINRLGIPTNSYTRGAVWEATGGLVHGWGGNLKSLFPSNHNFLESGHRVIGVRNAGVVPPPIQQQTPQPTVNRPPRIHMLFVWGTKATDTYWATMISKKKIIDSFNDDKYGIGLPPMSPNVASYTTLEGDNAHPKEIIKACRNMSKNAGPNDAVFVYILCHGASIIEDNDSTNTRIHDLSPVCESANAMNLREIGIRRSTIMRELKSNPHRLNVLITDSCSTLQSSHDPVASAIPGDVSVLEKVLLTGQGTININSSSPNVGGGEMAMSWIPGRKAGLTNDQYIEDAIQDSYSGTVFTNAFIDIAGERINKNQPYSVNEFIANLKKSLDEHYKSTKRMAKETNSKNFELFMNQSTQTLTQFNDNGVALP